jgi:regulator of sigma E protease
LLATLLDLLLVIIAFGLIIFFHELGHFLAARWAGIRVLAFALGFGPAIASYRKGLGLRAGSTVNEYAQRLATDSASHISPTEYRLNYLPFGGYVKMLGQDDLDPSAISSANDSYQSCKPWKRMVVISAGVIANLIIAALLFIIVFSIGLPTEPAKVGAVAPGSAASKAVATNSGALNLSEPGLLPGDEVLTINNKPATSFQDLVLASAMARPSHPVTLTIRRPGLDTPLDFSILPERSPLSGMLEIGIQPATSTRVHTKIPPAQLDTWKSNLAQVGLTGIEPGMRLASVGPSRESATPVSSPQELVEALRTLDGQPLTLLFSDTGQRHLHAVTITPEGQYQLADLDPDPTIVRVYDHIAGLAPVMTVAAIPANPRPHGLLPGDVFIRLGSLEYPSIAAGIAEINAHKGQTIQVIVERTDASGTPTRVSLSPTVTSKGLIGFTPGDTASTDTRVALPPPTFQSLDPLPPSTTPPSTPTTTDAATASPPSLTPPARSIITRPGTRILAVNNEPVTTFNQVRTAIVRATRASLTQAPLSPLSITLTIQPPLPATDTPLPTESVTLLLSEPQAQAIASLSWDPAFALGALFELEQTTLKADNPLHAVRMGVAETHRWMMMTYATFVRLFQGTVKVEHLKGPVGIAHIGTIVASEGTLKLLFFLALVSVNLAVVNFLPLPIVDGGQFLFLLFEQIRGKPVPIIIQNAATLAGLALIGCIFLIVTFNDIRSLL